MALAVLLGFGIGFGGGQDSTPALVPSASAHGLAPIPGDQTKPAVASDGSGFLVVWEDVNGIFGSRVDADGTTLDPNGIPIAGEGSELDVSFDGTNYLVV